MKLEDLAARIRRLDRAIFSVVACMGQEPSEKQVATFEKTLGFRLPQDFRELTMSPLGGLYIEVREEHWPRAGRFDVGPFWSFLYALKVFGISKDIPEWLDIREQHKEFQEFGHELVPFMAIQGNADRYCFDREGRIHLWDHETGETELVKRDLYALVIHEIDELAGRQKEKSKASGDPRPKAKTSAKPAKRKAVAKPPKGKPAAKSRQAKSVGKSPRGNAVVKPKKKTTVTRK